MVVCVVALSLIVGVGVCEEGFAACFFDAADDFVDEEGLDVVWIAEFACVQFDGDEVAFFDAIESARSVVEAVCFF